MSLASVQFSLWMATAETTAPVKAGHAFRGLRCSRNPYNVCNYSCQLFPSLWYLFIWFHFALNFSTCLRNSMFPFLHPFLTGRFRPPQQLASTNISKLDWKVLVLLPPIWQWGDASNRIDKLRKFILPFNLDLILLFCPAHCGRYQTLSFRVFVGDDHSNFLWILAIGHDPDSPPAASSRCTILVDVFVFPFSPWYMSGVSGSEQMCVEEPSKSIPSLIIRY